MPPRNASSDRTRAAAQPDDDRFFTCSDTWQAEAAAGRLLHNRPEQPATLRAIEQFRAVLLDPLERKFGRALLTCGFAGPEMVRAVRSRATREGRLPNIHPPGDQHAGHELGPRGGRICKRDGIAADLLVPDVTTSAIVDWARKNLPFDRIYFYGDARPFHLSWAPEPVGRVFQMVELATGRLLPRVVARGE